MVLGGSPAAATGRVYRAIDGREVPAGSFVGVEGELPGRTTALLRDQTAGIEARDGDTVVLRPWLARADR